MITTERTILRPWRDDDLDAFADMLADPEVQADAGGPVDRDAAARKMARYREAHDRLGFCRWVVTDPAGEFLGYVGIMPIDDWHPRAPNVEVGWRLVRGSWGSGIATEAARASLIDGFERCGLDEVLSYTAPDNHRSQAVMRKLGLERDEARDFTSTHDGHSWSGLVWVARRSG
ncbi:GNAT family N-acetyltransferase [Phenylobacterium sp.]|uniref:GNAT family N-acetyltransferase n=1 Tax=Phenylobacterium sp. TaxID=1871053 RepID=UPI002716CD98|nr:GNAT family N-acetyltransferase [Phenylobacterium sp.]MDO8800511.1 GNAT family N-acetyltransferase [Phenylobacterium sp.]